MKQNKTYIASIDAPFEYNDRIEIENVLETARHAFTFLDSGIEDIKYSIGKPNRHAIMANALNNLESAILEIESLRDQCLDEDQWRNLDKKIVWERLAS